MMRIISGSFRMWGWKMIFLSASSLEKSAMLKIATSVSMGVPSQNPS